MSPAWKQSGFRKAVYWKNAAITHRNSGAYGAWATGIAVTGGHVYVSGYAGDAGGYQVAVLWTDGSESFLTSTTSGVIGSASGVATSGTDVYVARTTEDTSKSPIVSQAEYWKNGSLTVLDPGSTSVPLPAEASTSAVAINGSDVYVLGSTLGPTPGNGGTYSPLPTVWKNGAPSTLISNLAYATGNALTISNGQVYVAGSYCSVTGPNCQAAAYWQNGSFTPVQTSPTSGAVGLAFASGIANVAINVIAGGYNQPEIIAAGKTAVLSSDTYSSANAIASYGTNVYVVGLDYYGACIWTNGVQQYLAGAQGGPQSVTATAIVIVPPS